MDIEYIVADPAGNITGLVLTAIPRAEHKKVANYLLEHSPHGLEQVGFISEEADCDGRLDMMGGEFCGNASRSFGLYLTSRGLSRRKDLTRIRVSGAKELLEVRTDEATGQARIKMPPVTAIQIIETEMYGAAPLVIMEGISHLILEGHPVEQEKAEGLIRTLAGIHDADALGIMYYDEAEHFLTPLVYVRATDTLYWESSCGSGSVALAVWLMQDQKGPWQVEFSEPGGKLAVEESAAGDVYLGGPVSFSGIITAKLP